MAFPTLPFDISNCIMIWLKLEDLLQLATVHVASNRHVRLIIANSDPHDLLEDSHLFISWRNWKVALCAILKTIRRPSGVLTYGQRLYPSIYDDRNRAILAVHITTAGIISMQMAYDWQISPEEWFDVGHVVSPMCIACAINTKCRA